MEETHLKETICVLVVEDNLLFSQAVEAMLRHSFSSLSTILMATSLSDAINKVNETKVGVILLDLTLPDSNGLQTLVSMCSNTKAPIVVLTGDDDEKSALEALRIGAQDYLLKGDINHRQLTRSICYSIERHRSQQINAERMRLYEQREDFMATLTHDMKNPLIGANRILELLASGGLGELPAQHVKPLLTVMQSNEALLALIRNLIEVYRFEKDLDTIEKENTDLRKLVNIYLDTVGSILEDKQIEISVECQTIGDVAADHNSMLRVVQNLVENAIKFTPSGGSISIKLWTEQSNVFFQIADTGPGVPENEQKRLFQRFFQGRRGKESTFGTGLGLYLCRQIIEAHDGRIWCENSVESRGATFTLSLPATAISV
jgi:two-component system, sensor histidine kinase and response regulator